MCNTRKSKKESIYTVKQLHCQNNMNRGRKEILSLPDPGTCAILCERETIEPGGCPPFTEGLTLQTKERRALPMYVTYSDLKDAR